VRICISLQSIPVAAYVFIRVSWNYITDLGNGLRKFFWINVADTTVRFPFFRGAQVNRLSSIPIVTLCTFVTSLSPLVHLSLPLFPCQLSLSGLAARTAGETVRTSIAATTATKSFWILYDIHYSLDARFISVYYSISQLCHCISLLGAS